MELWSSTIAMKFFPSSVHLLIITKKRNYEFHGDQLVKIKVSITQRLYQTILEKIISLYSEKRGSSPCHNEKNFIPGEGPYTKDDI